MERIPFEVWESIFAFSCVDGGRTGCSLSLVSKAFHEASRRYRYHSVTLKGLTAALKFVQILDKYPRKDLRSQGDFSIKFATSGHTAVGIRGAQVVGITSPTIAKNKSGRENLHSVPNAIPTSIHHLYVTDQFPHAYLEPSPSFASKVTTKIFKRNNASSKGIVQMALASDPSQSIESLMHATLYKILVAAAPTLQTLSIYVAFDTHVPAIPSLPFLTELTLNYAFESYIRSMAQVIRTLEKPLPSLRMLDLLGLKCHADPEEIFYQVAKVAGRNLTHIYLPVIRAENIWDMRPEEDHAFWGENDHTGLTVHMQSDPWYEQPEHGVPYDEWSRALDSLDRKASQGGRRVVFSSRERPISKCHEEQEQNWLESVIGGRGRWIR